MDHGRFSSRNNNWRGVLFAGIIAGCSFITFGATSAPQGYIDRSAFDVTPVLPESPTMGSTRYDADREIFRRTRRLEGTERWAMAVNDVGLTSADMMRDFSCSAGVTLTPESAPHFALLVSTASADTNAESARAKQFFKRVRPFQIDSGPICEPASNVINTYDYPSGHTTQGWAWATILAELIPSRARAILARGRAFGESRIVCGVHNASAVEAGRLSAAATLAAIRATAAYQSDFTAARAELTSLAASARPPEAHLCKEEADLVAQDVVDSGATGSNP